MIIKLFQQLFNVLKKKGVSSEPPLPSDLKPSDKPDPFVEGLHPKLSELADEIVAECADQGMQVKMFSGFRSWKEQGNLYAKGRTKPGNKVTNAKPGRSWHNYGLAIDMVFLKNGRWSWSEEHDWEKLGEIGKSFGLEWGGDWKRFRDRPHFQLTKGLKISQAISLHKKGGLKEVWDKVGI